MKDLQEVDIFKAFSYSQPESSHLEGLNNNVINIIRKRRIIPQYGEPLQQFRYQKERIIQKISPLSANYMFIVFDINSQLSTRYKS